MGAGATGRTAAHPHNPKSLRASTASAPAWPGRPFLQQLVEYYKPQIQAALSSYLNPQELAAHYYEHQTLPDHGDTVALAQVLDLIYKDSYLAGSHVGATQVQKAGAAPEQVWLAAVPATTAFNWDAWTPGNPAAALLTAARDGGGSGLQDLLNQAHITLKGIDDTTMAGVADALSQSLAEGLGASEAGKLVSQVLDDPARSELIAQTETSRAVTNATLDQYRENGVVGKTWLLSDGACALCEENEADGEVSIDDDFTNGDPPVHPYCVCAVAPVLADGSEGDSSDTGDVEVEVPGGNTTTIGDFDLDWQKAFAEVPMATDDVGAWVTANGELGEEYARMMSAWTNLSNDASAIARAALGDPSGIPALDEAGDYLASFLGSAPDLTAPIFRGGIWEGEDLPGVNDSVQLRPSSFSLDESIASSYMDTADEDLGHKVMIEVSGGRGLPVLGLSSFDEVEQEVIGAGRFTVRSVEQIESKYDSYTHIVLEQQL